MPKPIVVVVANQKGGIGKSSTSVELAANLNRLGHRTLLIDTDDQGNSTDTCCASIEGAITLYDVLLESERVHLGEAIQKTKYTDVIAGDPLLRRADTILSSDMDGAFRLADVINDAVPDISEYEYIIIDTAPKLGELTKNALLAADEVIIPVTADRYAVQGLSYIVKSVHELKRRQNPKIKIAGVLLASYPDRTNLGKEVWRELIAISKSLGTKVYGTPIRRTIKVSEAHAKRMPVFAYDPECTAAKDYMQVTKEFLADHIKNEEV